jgi:hypothetical protein
MHGSSFLVHFTVHDLSHCLKACSQIWIIYTIPKIQFMYFENETARPCSQFLYIHVSERDADRSAYLAAAK